MVHEALLYEKLDFDSVQCLLCNHYCHIASDHYGTCQVRKNHKGKLFTLSYGKVNGSAIDPIEKKPLYHFKPGSKVYSFGTPGCNLSCLNCQNSTLSQSVRNSEIDITNIKSVSPAELVKRAVRSKADGIAYTYSEPTIFFEYARDIILEARKHKESADLFHVFVSNGYFSLELIDLMDKENLIQAINIDLKFSNESKYASISGGRFIPVYDSIRRIYDLRNKIHLELTNLIIPGENDSDEDILKLCDYIKSISTDIPLHFSRFFPRFRMLDKPATPLESLIRAREIALKAGLHYVYIGNTESNDASNTFCPVCSENLIFREGYKITYNAVTSNLKCPNCRHDLNFII